MSARWRIGFDIGGTFTDFILADAEAGSIRLHKCLTTPHDPSVGALAGLAELTEAGGIALSDVAEIIHGTTLVTNAIIERKGAPLGLITTQGFRDLLEMGTEQRYDIYDLFLRYPDPLVACRRRPAFAATGHAADLPEPACRAEPAPDRLRLHRGAAGGAGRPWRGGDAGARDDATSAGRPARELPRALSP
jgi:hypothetical protein